MIIRINLAGKFNNREIKGAGICIEFERREVNYPGTEGELHRCSNIIGDAMGRSIYACKLVENYIC